MYYIELKDNQIIAKSFNGFTDEMIPTTKEIYDAIEWMPAKAIINKEGVVTSVEMIGEKPVIEEPLSIEDRVELQIAQNTTETLELISYISEQQKIEQAQSSAELIELILSMRGDL